MVGVVIAEQSGLRKLVNKIPDKKLTDEEIVKALECCTTNGASCKDCPAFVKVDRSNCKKYFCGALDLINRLQEEKQNLEIELQAMRNAANGFKAENENLKLDIATLEAKNFAKDKLLEKAEIKLEEAEDTIQYANKELKKVEAENERLKYCNESNISSIATLHEQLKTAKAEAYKEFAKKLKHKAINIGVNDSIVSTFAIDETLKELVGDSK